ncbi:Oxidoreductase, short chain dehydrogenase/reductase [Sulfobacillus acidophilus TPY]|nr:Oxidoreductase, short chain dehydrogenase/reductase [Sulfobacillus acidophilus TPY]
MPDGFDGESRVGHRWQPGDRGRHIRHVSRARSSRCRQLVDRIHQAGGDALDIAADVRNPDEVHRLVETIVDRWGLLDILINNAGMSFVMKPIADMTWDEFAQKLNER